MSIESPKPDSVAPNSHDTNQEKGLLGRAKKFMRSKVGIGATVLASGLALSTGTQAKEGSKSGFERAFQDARKKGQSEFVWEGKKYAAKLVSKEFESLFQESKDFLNHYYSSDYFKSKTVYPADSSYLLTQYVANANPELVRKIDSLTEQQQYLNRSEEEDTAAVQGQLQSVKSELDSLYGVANQAVDSISKTDFYAHELDTEQRARQEVYLSELNAPVHLVVTSQPAKNALLGYYHAPTDDGAPAKMFISKKEQESDELTPVHELTHKATVYMSQFSPLAMDDLRDQAEFYIDQTHDSLITRYPDIDSTREETANPFENISRMSTVRFWLHKHDPSYDETKPFTEKDYATLEEHFPELPTDLRKLLDVFPEKDVFIADMNKY